MKTHTLFSMGLALLGTLATASDALTQERTSDPATQSLSGTVVNQEFSKGRGSFRTAALEYRLQGADTTFLLTPIYGEREAAGTSKSALGVGATVYMDWAKQVSSRTYLSIAADEPVFAHTDIAQDLTFRIADKTTATIGGRWAEYFGDRQVSFLSLGARRYFGGGSIAYRATRTAPEGQSAFYAHLLNLSLNDKKGEGKSQVWASTGATSLDRAQYDATFSGNDRAFLIQRIQPVSRNLALVATAGVAKYDIPGGHFSGTNLGLGFKLSLD